MSSTYVTVAIPYVNADPHLGYAYELVLADIYARSRRAAGDKVRFLGGTDDYSLKNVLAAETAGQPTGQFVNQAAARFQALTEPLGLSFDDYIRTSTDPRHRPAVHRIWQAAAGSGDLYQRHYEGDYCVGCEQFYDPSELEDGHCPEHRAATERVTEENWFFRLSRFQDYLDDLISSDRLVIRPEPFRREALAFIRAGLEDISVSRSIERARGWGIPVPDDPAQVIYVWFDALTNYISALGFGDPQSGDYQQWWLDADHRIHVIGKGILRFHAIYWPAFLASAGQPPPTRIQVHPYLTIDGHKISKSQGTTINPTELIDTYGVDALRWFFARDVNNTVDTDFTTDRMTARANDELANSIGNAANRLVTLAHRYLAATVAAQPPLPELADLPQQVTDAISHFDLRAAAHLIAHAATTLNTHISATEPWTIAKDPTRHTELSELLGTHLASARHIATALTPVLPDLATRLHHQLGDPNQPLPQPEPVYKRIT
ncbi:MAG: methionine--tRNA ligase [Actinomycetia bacterium]|nr:methionine--tRNA ligase [Actinomycetes bacterium]